MARRSWHRRSAAPAGVDSIGDRILADLAREGVDATHCVRVPGATSPISAITVDASGERLIVNHRDERLAGASVADPDALVWDCDALLADNRFAQFVLPLCRAARARGIPVLLDGDRPTASTDELLTVCTHVVFAADGLRATTGCDELERGLRLIAERTDAFLAVTDGANGVLWLARGLLQQFPAYGVEAVDTLGCGDVFHGAFVLGLAEGQSEPQALAFATAAAGIKCTRFGGIAGAPTRVEVAAWLAKEPLPAVGTQTKESAAP